jgi:peptide-methionine (S)-S-oxide reductase
MTNNTSTRRSILFVGLALALAGCLISAMRAAPNPGAPGHVSTTIAPKPPTGREYATLAAGCFWSMEAIFKQLKGVDKVDPGYAGGKVVKPSYDQVCTGKTGHAEAINITFDPKVISYKDLVRVLLTVRNPTTVDKQGNDEGPQYRSVIFYRNEDQRKDANEVIQKITEERLWRQPIVTKVTPFSNFFRAEEEHIDYYHLNPDNPYCANVIAPEIKEFREKFASKLKH